MKILDRLISRLSYLLIFFLPWQTRYFLRPGEINGGYCEYTTYSLYAVDLLILLLAGLSLIRAIKAREKIRLRGAWLLVIIFTIAAAALTLAGIDLTLSLSRIFWLLAALFIAYLISACPAISKRMAWRMFLLSAILPAILGISQFVNNYAGSNKYLGLAEQRPEVLGVSVVEYNSNLGVERQLRAYGPFGHPNILGGFLVLVLLSAVIYFRRRKNCDWYQARPRLFLVLFGLYFILITSALILSFSRAAILAALLSIFVYWFLADPYSSRRQSQERSWVLGTVCLFLIFLSLSLYPLWSARLDNENRLSVISQSERLTGYSQAQKIVKDNWLLGVGLGNYTNSLVRIAPQEPAYFYQPVHNVWLLILVETGIVGLLISLVLIFFLFLKYLPYNQPELAAFLSGLIVLTMLDHWLFSLHFGWLLLGIIFSGAVWGIDQKREEE
ncbi:MAG TPA: O-antigen ligase family protein [bacterium]|nr:O-antigen ligase family protein [bacterium]HPT29361.1 O-antigen ligase family protein [bacterium]